MNTKKFAVSLGGFLAVTAPIVAVISCGNNSHDKNPNEKIAKQFNDKLKQNIKTTLKKVSEITINPSNKEVKPEALGIQEQVKKIGVLPKGTEWKLYVLDKKATCLKIKSIITYDIKTSAQGQNEIEFDLQTAKLSNQEIVEYNIGLLDTENGYKTTESNSKVAELPKANEAITTKQLGIKDFAFEGVTDVKMTVKSKGVAKDNEDSGTIVVNVTVTSEGKEQGEKASKSVQITVYGFSESQIAKNEEKVKNAVKALEKASTEKTIKYAGYKGSIESEDSEEIDKSKINGLPKEVTELSDYSFEYSKVIGTQGVTAKLSEGKSKYQTYKEKVTPVHFEYNDEKKAVQDLSETIKKIDTTSFSYDEFKKIFADPGKQIKKTQIQTKLGIEFKNNDPNEEFTYEFEKKVETEKNKNIEITLGIYLYNEQSHVTFTLKNFNEEKSDVKNVTEYLNQPFESDKTSDEIKKLVVGAEGTKNINITSLKALLGLNIDIENFPKTTKEPTFTLNDVKKNEKVVFTVKIGAVEQKVTIKLQFTFSQTIVEAKQNIKKAILATVKQNPSSKTFADLEKIEVVKNKNITALSNELGIKLNDIGLLPDSKSTSYNLKKVSANNKQKVITFTITILIGESTPFDFEVKITAIDVEL